MLSKLLGYVCIGTALFLIAIVLDRNFGPRSSPLVFSPTQLLSATWDSYKRAYLEPSTYRTVDRQRSTVTTSEGQSYTMLRAVWAGDKDTFDGAWKWTRENLGRPDDALLAWLWGIDENGRGRVLTEQNGQNSATDADSDIALALLFAYARWQEPSYLEDARAIIDDLWDIAVIDVHGRLVFAANSVEKKSKSPWIVVNPSYLSPASYRLFSMTDPDHAWEKLRSDSYALLAESVGMSFDGKPSAQLPPNWLRISRATGQLAPTTTPELDARFGYDALRVPFRIALDAEWFGNPEAKRLLETFTFLSEKWKSEGRLASIYTHDGSVSEANEAAALYGGTIGYFMNADRRAARRVYEQKLISLYDPSTGTWSTPLSYYDDNWVWFGIALYNRALPNLAEQLPATAFSK